MGGIAFFMICTALIVLFPVVLQLRDGESRLGGVWGYFVFIVGLLLIAAGDTTPGRAYQAVFTIAGMAAVLIGLIVQSRRTQTTPPDQPS
jgi:membrane-bound ClpP family serine protease